jgi:hypothetical protein
MDASPKLIALTYRVGPLGDLAQLIEEVHGGQVGWGQLTEGPDAGGPKRHDVGEQPLDQVVGGVLERGQRRRGKASKTEPNVRPSRRLHQRRPPPH